MNGPLEAFSGASGDHSNWTAIRADQDFGIVFGWEFNGRARAQAELRQDTGAPSFTSQVMRLSHPVAPGDGFAVPGAFLGLFRGDWDEAGCRTQRFVEAIMAARPPGSEEQRFPYVAFDSWKYIYDIDEALLRKAAALAAGMGAELFSVDLGWAKVIGD